MPYTLRPYQDDAVNTIIKHFKGTYERPFIVQGATGMGKSLVIADVCHQLDAPTLILQPSKELLEQNYAKLQSYGIDDIAIYSASLKSKEIGKYTFATIGSIYKKPELFRQFKYVLVDECDLINPKNMKGMYLSFFNAIHCKKICGLTATPYRLIQRFHFDERGQRIYTSHLQMLNRIPPFFFAKIAYKIETQDLIDQKYLAPLEYHTEDVDWSRLRINSTGADFKDDSLEAFWGDSQLDRLVNTIEHIDQTHNRNLVFCTSVTKAEATQRLLAARGINAAIVTAKTPAKERVVAVDAFRRGDVRHMLNVGVFLAGFDIPQLDSVVMARPTMSLRVWYQAVGRAVRLDPDNPNKVAHIYDLAGVTQRMGRVETIRLEKEVDGWRDKVVSETGDMTGVPLFSFVVKRDIFKTKDKKDSSVTQISVL